MTLVCSNPDCESHKEDYHAFTINVTVDEDRIMECENLNKVEAEYFVCDYCQSEAAEGGAK